MPTPTLTDQTIRFKAAFLAPKYWPTWLLFGLIGLSASLPRPISIKIGDAIGVLYRKINHKRRRIVDINLKLCFPELDAQQLNALAKDHFRFYGRSVIDLGLTWWASKKRLARLIHFKNEHYYLDTLKQHNVILLLPHMTGLDCGAGYSAILHPSITMMKLQKNELVNWRLWKGRTRLKPTRVIMRDQGLRPLIRAAKNGTTCYYMPDEDFGTSKLTTFAPFFSIQTSTLTTLSAMAKMAKAKVVPIYPIMLENGHYEVSFDKPLDSFPSDDALVDATRVNQAVEKCIMRAPAQYMWTLQWFKTRPEGEASPYAPKA
ncbi:MAG: lysophospholipid acyltransferase family protein [Arenicellales bacterium]